MTEASWREKSYLFLRKGGDSGYVPLTELRRLSSMNDKFNGDLHLSAKNISLIIDMMERVSTKFMECCFKMKNISKEHDQDILYNMSTHYVFVIQINTKQ